MTLDRGIVGISFDTDTLGAPEDAIMRRALEAEAAGVDFIVLGDGKGLAGGDPSLLSAAILARTERIGVLFEFRPKDHRPYNLARRAASLDLLGQGRAGILVDAVDGSFDDEFLAVVKGLWASWEPDAFVNDKIAGRYFDPSRMHVLHHEGVHFSVRGPLNVDPSPQGRPIIAISLNRTNVRLAARHADLVLVGDDDDALLAHLLRELAKEDRQRTDIRIVGKGSKASDEDGILIDDGDRFHVRQVQKASHRTFRETLGLPDPHMRSAS